MFVDKIELLMEERQESSEEVLCVDLDGTLLSSDLLHESFFASLRARPLVVLPVLGFLLRGDVPAIKEHLANSSEIDFASLPWNSEVLEFIESEKALGKKVVLATASHQILAEKVAEHLGLFDAVVATSADTNLKGKKKLETLRSEYASESIVYMGDSKADLPIWKSVEKSYVVHPSEGLKRRLSREGISPARVFEREIKSWRWIRAVRVHQWVKNFLLFVPLIMAHAWGSPDAWIAAFLGFFAFSFTASSVYLLNDLLDLEADRKHHRKRFRPLAAGEIPIFQGTFAFGALLLSGIALSFLLPLEFSLTLFAYFAMTTFYSLSGKRIALLDILLLASLYTLRVLAGGTATSIPVSEWLLAYSVFLFLSLGAVKRFVELHRLKGTKAQAAPGRGYQVEDLPVVSGLGLSSGYISVLVFALYLNAAKAQALYSLPQLLWVICFPLLYWISRVWLLAFRGQLHDDPIVFAIRDKTSYFVGAICLLILYAAI